MSGEIQGQSETFDEEVAAISGTAIGLLEQELSTSSPQRLNAHNRGQVVDAHVRVAMAALARDDQPTFEDYTSRLHNFLLEFYGLPGMMPARYAAGLSALHMRGLRSFVGYDRTPLEGLMSADSPAGPIIRGAIAGFDDNSEALRHWLLALDGGETQDFAMFRYFQTMAERRDEEIMFLQDERERNFQAVLEHLGFDGTDAWSLIAADLVKFAPGSYWANKAIDLIFDKYVLTELHLSTAEACSKFLDFATAIYKYQDLLAIYGPVLRRQIDLCAEASRGFKDNQLNYKIVRAQALDSIRRGAEHVVSETKGLQEDVYATSPDNGYRLPIRSSIRLEIAEIFITYGDFKAARQVIKSIDSDEAWALGLTNLAGFCTNATDIDDLGGPDQLRDASRQVVFVIIESLIQRRYESAASLLDVLVTSYKHSNEAYMESAYFVAECIETILSNSRQVGSRLLEAISGVVFARPTHRMSLLVDLARIGIDHGILRAALALRMLVLKPNTVDRFKYTIKLAELTSPQRQMIPRGF